MRALIIVVVFFFSAPLISAEKIQISADQLANLGVKLGKLTEIKSVPLLDAPAKVSIPPENEFLVSAVQAGLVSKINISIADEVQKGQVLATIKSPELLALQQQHLTSMHELQLAKLEFARAEKLYKEGVIADRRWLQAKNSYQVFMAKFNETRQLLDISGVAPQGISALEKTRQLSSQLNIVAPISGVVLERKVIAGERVDALSPLFRIANLDKLWLDINIPQQRIEQVHVGDKVIVDGLGVSARIFLLGKHVDEQNQTVLVRAEIDSASNQIRLGQTVNVKISQSSTQSMFKVPNSALAQIEGISYIFMRTQTGFAALPVQVLGRIAQATIVTGRLQANSEIAIKGAVALKANFLGLGSDE